MRAIRGVVCSGARVRKMAPTHLFGRMMCDQEGNDAPPTWLSPPALYWALHVRCATSTPSTRARRDAAGGRARTARAGPCAWVCGTAGAAEVYEPGASIVDVATVAINVAESVFIEAEKAHGKKCNGEQVSATAAGRLSRAHCACISSRAIHTV